MCDVSATFFSAHFDDRCIPVRLGGHLLSRTASRTWSRLESMEYINHMDLWAIFRSLQSSEDEVKEKSILLKLDNSTMVLYINQQGGTKSPTLCLHTRDLLRWCIHWGVSIFAVHITGVSNVLADNLSRGISLSSTELPLSL